MTVQTQLVNLPTGTAKLCRTHPPVEAAVGARLGWFLENVFGGDEKPDVFVIATARGEYEAVSRNEFVWAECDGQIVSAAWTISPVDDLRIGSIGDVFTAEPYRGRGLARFICEELLSAFDGRGGRCMFLATGNPIAERLYRQLGFQTVCGQLMRRASDAFEAEWFHPSPVAIRPLIWGDLPRLIALYASPSEWVGLCMMQGFLSSRYVPYERANSFMKLTWQATRRGLWLGLFNANGALVGSCPVVPIGNEQHVLGGQLDIFLHSAFRSQTATLLTATAQQAQANGWHWLIAWVASSDEEKRDWLAQVGFVRQTTLSDGVMVGDQLQTLELWRWAW